MEDIGAKRYRRIYTAPEQLSGKEFQKLFRQESWAKSLIAVVVDEAHVVVEWSETFRPHYKEISDLRHTPGYNIPILALSATLSDDVYATLKSTQELRLPEVINIGCDRPNILFKVDKFQYAMDSFLDVRKYMPEIETLQPGGACCLIGTHVANCLYSLSAM